MDTFLQILQDVYTGKFQTMARKDGRVSDLWVYGGKKWKHCDEWVVSCWYILCWISLWAKLATSSGGTCVCLPPPTSVAPVGLNSHRFWLRIWDILYDAHYFEQHKPAYHSTHTCWLLIHWFQIFNVAVNLHIACLIVCKSRCDQR